MNKEVQEILKILKYYNNTIQTKFVSVIFENLKFKYKLNKEIRVILNILKSYDNVIPDELISKIFENLKFVYRTPLYTEFVLHKNKHITNYQRIYEIDNQFYEFSFSFEMPTNKTRTIKFNKIKEKKEVIEYINNLLEKYYKDLEYYSDKKFFSDKIKHLEQLLNNLTT